MTEIRMRHAPKCPDRRVETTASVFDPLRVTHRCVGCGATVFVYHDNRSSTVPWPTLERGPDAA